jgi:hypothetical protein
MHKLKPAQRICEYKFADLPLNIGNKDLSEENGLIPVAGFSNSSNKHQVSVNPLSNPAANGSLVGQLVRSSRLMEAHHVKSSPDPKVIINTCEDLPDTGLGTLKPSVCG